MNSITLFLFFIPALALILLGINLIFAPHNPYQEKSSTFECGFHSFLGQNRMQFSISFFIFALLFLVFDLELVMTLPGFISMSVITYYGLFFVIVFLTILTSGFAFEIGKKALKIDSRQYHNTLPSNIGIIYTTFVYIALKIFMIEQGKPVILFNYPKEKFQLKQIGEIIVFSLYLYIDLILLAISTYIMLFIPPIAGCMIVLCPQTLITCIISIFVFCATNITVCYICFPYIYNNRYDILWRLYWVIIVIGILIGINTDPEYLLIPVSDGFGIGLILMDSNGGGGNFGGGPSGGGNPFGGGPPRPPKFNFGPPFNDFGPNSRNGSIHGSPNETNAEYEKRMQNRLYLSQLITDLQSRNIPVSSASQAARTEALFSNTMDYKMRGQLEYNLNQLLLNQEQPLDIYNGQWQVIENGKYSLRGRSYKQDIVSILGDYPDYTVGHRGMLHIRSTHADNTNTLFYPTPNSSRRVIATPEVIDNVETVLKARYPTRGGFFPPFK